MHATFYINKFETSILAIGRDAQKHRVSFLRAIMREVTHNVCALCREANVSTAQSKIVLFPASLLSVTR